MLLRSQPLSEEVSKKLEEKSRIEIDAMNEDNIKSQHIGHFFDDLIEGKRKIKLKTRFKWKWDNLKGAYHDLKYAVRNRFKWRKIMNQLRPWEGFDGLLRVMQKHLSDYVESEEKYGHAAIEYKERKIATAKETIELLERMNKPDEYSFRRREEVDSLYPDYKQLITRYTCGGVGISGYFIAQGIGWVGKESGNNPREGYFEFFNGRFELTASPDQTETDKLLTQIKGYHKDIGVAYRQAEVDSDEDFERLSNLLKENLYSWWD